MTQPPDATPPAHDYAGALDEFNNWMGQPVCAHCDEFLSRRAEEIRHALTAMQEITRALPVGVDPVKVVRGVAEPSGKVLQELFGMECLLPVAKHKYKNGIAQLYREASEGAGE